MLAITPRLHASLRRLGYAAALVAAGACQPALPAPSSAASPPPNAVAARPPAPQGVPPAAPAPAPRPRAQVAQGAGPDGAASTALEPDGAASTALEPDGAASTALEGKAPLKLAPPPFAYVQRTRPAPPGGAPAPRLAKRSERRNEITDEQAWFARNGLSLPTLPVPNTGDGRTGTLPPTLPPRFGPNVLVKAIDHGDHLVLIYGPSHADGRFVAVLDPGHRLTALLDFESYLTPPASEAKEAGFVQSQVVWAVVEGGVLYASTSHRTYAASSKGKNAFLSAIELATGQLLWQSAPLVCNTQNFLLRGEHLVCGYGFTAEPDFLYVLERATGKVAAKVPLKSGPDYIIEKDGKLFVRTYDTDYVFEIR